MSDTLLSKLEARAKAIAGHAFDILSVTAQLVDGDTITIGNVTYEADDDSSVTSGNIAVDITGNGSVAADIDDLKVAILANQGDDVRVVDLGDQLAIIGRNGAPIATSETSANAVWLSGGGSYSGDEPYNDISIPAMKKRVPSASEVTLGKMAFAFGKTPTAVEALVRVTSTGVRKAWDGGITILGELVLLDNTGSVDWAATDTVVILATFN